MVEVVVIAIFHGDIGTGGGERSSACLRFNAPARELHQEKMAPFAAEVAVTASASLNSGYSLRINKAVFPQEQLYRPAMLNKKIRILCVDDHAFLVEGLNARFELENDFELVGRLSTAENLVDEVKTTRAQIVLLDIEMPGPDPFDALAELRRQCESVRVIMLSAYIRDHYIDSAYKAGAWGYFSKSDEMNAIVEGIRKVAGGEFSLGPKVQERCQPLKGVRAEKGKAPASKLDLLTAREQEVLRLIGRGMSRTQIATTLSRSPKTIDGHREMIMQKLDIHDRGELVRYAIREGLVEA
jgi:DNA-binding NarL/FixJ family response regulator